MRARRVLRDAVAPAEGTADLSAETPRPPRSTRPLATRVVPGALKRPSSGCSSTRFAIPSTTSPHPIQARLEEEIGEARGIAQPRPGAPSTTRAEIQSAASRATRAAPVALKIGIAKPDFGFVGGYERVIERIAHELHRSGHSVTWIKVDAIDVPRLPYDVPLPRHVAPELWEFQRYGALIQTFAELDTSEFDLMISTQPPSFAIQHERHLSVFSHHQRIYYDLEDVHVAAGFADEELHRKIAAAVRQLDQPLFEGVSYFLAASEEVAGRLERFNGLGRQCRRLPRRDRLRARRAGRAGIARGGDWYAIYVGRHEFPNGRALHPGAEVPPGPAGA